MPPKEFICGGLSLRGFWLINWIRNAPSTEVKEIYQKLGDLVADESLSTAVEHVYPLDQFKEAFKQFLKSNRSGKVLFKLRCSDNFKVTRNSNNEARLRTTRSAESSQSDLISQQQAIHDVNLLS